MVSLFSNLVVVAVMLLRPQKLRSTHVLIMALAASDIMFSLVISVISKLIIIFVQAVHPMLIATSLGSDVATLFTKSGGQFNQNRAFQCSSGKNGII